MTRAPADVLFYGPAGTLSCADFRRRAATAAASLARQVAPAAPLINLCLDRERFAVAFAAAASAGFTTLLCSDRSPERLAALSARYPAARALGDPAPLAATGSLAPLDARQIDGGASDPALPRGTLLRDALPASRVVAEVFTSGSTGAPVAHAKRWGALVQRSLAAARRFGIGAEGTASLVGTVAPQHMYGFETTIMLPLHCEVAVWTGPSFFPEDVRVGLESMPPPRYLVTTPLQLRTLLEAQTILPTLRAIISASAPLGPALALQAERRWGAEVLEIFGATEVGSIASRQAVQGEPWTLYDGLSLVADEGEVRVVADTAAPEPLQDLVDLVDDRRFHLLDRRADMVKIAGRRASLAGLNRVLTAIEGVEDGAFLPPEEQAGGPIARMQAFVVAPHRGSREIMAVLRRHIDPAFLPRDLVFVDRLPRNEMGKLPRAALAGLQARAPSER